jgi:hypothetical protein
VSIFRKFALRCEPLSRRKPGPIYPLLVPPRDGPRLFAGEAFNIVCRREPPCFLLALDTSRVRSTVLRERVHPLKPEKPREVAIRRADRGAVFERDRGEDSVRDKRAGSLSVARQSAQDFPVPFARIDDPWGWLAELGGNRTFGFGGGKRTFEHQGFVAILRKVSQAKRTRSGPESTVSSQTRIASCCSPLGC